MSFNNSILELETLNKEYDLTLKQYNKAMSDYLELTKNTINTQQPKPKTEQECTFMGGKSFAVCASNDTKYCPDVCTGIATCNSDSKLYNNACINTNKKQEKILLEQIDRLNYELSEIANNIIAIDERIDSKYKSAELNEGRIGNEQLKSNLAELHIEKQKIEKSLAAIENLEQEEHQGELVVTSNYYNYIMYLIIAVLCVLFLFMLGIFNDNAGYSNSYSNNYNRMMGGFTYNKK